MPANSKFSAFTIDVKLPAMLANAMSNCQFQPMPNLLVLIIEILDRCISHNHYFRIDLKDSPTNHNFRNYLDTNEMLVCFRA